jgi:hypothetical protein
LLDRTLRPWIWTSKPSRLSSWNGILIILRTFSLFNWPRAMVLVELDVDELNVIADWIAVIKTAANSFFFVQKVVVGVSQSFERITALNPSDIADSHRLIAWKMEWNASTSFEHQVRFAFELTWGFCVVFVVSRPWTSSCVFLVELSWAVRQLSWSLAWSRPPAMYHSRIAAMMKQTDRESEPKACWTCSKTDNPDWIRILKAWLAVPIVTFVDDSSCLGACSQSLEST